MTVKIIVHAEYNRKDNRIENPAYGFLEGNVYPLLNVGFGGLMIGGYEGKLMPGMGCTVKGLGLDENNLVDVHIDCTVARRLDNEIGIGFVELDSRSYEVLETLIMRRGKFKKK